jgi:RimJ/RimL family protein N-acetyltransferase
MVTLAPLRPEDFELAAAWLADTQISRWLTSEFRGQETGPRMVAVMARSKRNRLLLVRHEGEPVGLVGFADFDEIDRTAMIWYLLGHRPAGSRGIITAAVGAALDLAFEQWGLANVYAWIIDGNEPSRRVLEKNGFSVVGRLRRATRRGDEQVDRIYYDVTAQERRSSAADA